MEDKSSIKGLKALLEKKLDDLRRAEVACTDSNEQKKISVEKARIKSTLATICENEAEARQISSHYKSSRGSAVFSNAHPPPLQSKHTMRDEARKSTFEKKLSNFEAGLNHSQGVQTSDEARKSAFEKKLSNFEAGLNHSQGVQPSGERVKQLTVRNSTTHSQKKNIVDLCFLVDATASMRPWIDMTKDKITRLVKEAKQEFPSIDFRIAAVVYRDYDVEINGLELHPFTAKSSEIESFLEGVKTQGSKNADIPENIYGGFTAILDELQWNSSIKMLIHFADAPCHGSRFTDDKDNHPYPPSQLQCENWETLWMKVFERLKNLEINYHFMEIDKNCTQKMIKAFREMWNISKSRRSLVETCFDVHPVTADAKALFKLLKDSVTITIKRSL